MCKIKNLYIATLAAFFTICLSSPIFAKSNIDSLNKELISKVSFGRAGDVAYLLEDGASPNATSPAGLSALHLAAGRNDPQATEITKALLSKGADIYKTDPRGNMPIIEAVRTGTPQTVKLLIDNKALLSVKNHNGVTLEKLAEQRGNKEIISYVKVASEAERKKIAELISGDGLTKHIQKYALLACANQYLKFYKAENPAGMTKTKYDDVMAKNQSETTELGERIKALFDMKEKDLINIRTTSKKLIQEDLDRLLTKENRLYNGFGKNDHLNKGCRKVAEYWDGKRFTYIEQNDKRIKTGNK